MELSCEEVITWCQGLKIQPVGGGVHPTGVEPLEKVGGSRTLTSAAITLDTVLGKLQLKTYKLDHTPHLHVGEGAQLWTK